MIRVSSLFDVRRHTAATERTRLAALATLEGHSGGLRTLPAGAASLVIRALNALLLWTTFGGSLPRLQ